MTDTPDQHGLEYVRTGVPIALKEPGSSERKLKISTLRLSPDRVTFLANTYCHPKSRGTIDLPKQDGSVLRVSGSLKWCEHREGVKHEALLEFEEMIELEGLIPPAALKKHKEAQAKAEAERAAGGAPVSVLYIDDHDADRMLIERRAQGTRLELVAVATTGPACDLLHERTFDAVVCDYYLEHGSGIDAMGMFRPELHGGPVIILTAESSEAELEKMRAAGADAVLAKPVDVAHLLATLDALGVGENEAGERGFDEFDAAPTDVKLTLSFIPILERHRDDFARAKSRRKVEDARSVCRAIKGCAGGFGFERLSRAAERALAAIDISGSLDLAGEPVADFLKQMNAILGAAEAPNQAA